MLWEQVTRARTGQVIEQTTTCTSIAAYDLHWHIVDEGAPGHQKGKQALAGFVRKSRSRNQRPHKDPRDLFNVPGLDKGLESDAISSYRHRHRTLRY